MLNQPKVCLSYSCNKKYLKYLERGLFTLNKNSPDCHAYVDLINCNTDMVFKNITINNTEIETKDKLPVRKCFRPQHFKEYIVPFSGAYANLKKVYNIYNILNLNKFDLVVNMDADNLIQKDILSFDGLYGDDYDILIRFRDKPLFGGELLTRKENFKTFDLSMINLELEDRCFREGCFVARNNEATKEFFKFIQDNILKQIEWYADSYWFLRAFQKFKNNIRVKKLPSNFVAYDLETELEGAFVASGYGINKYSPIYKKLLSDYDK